MVRLEIWAPWSTVTGYKMLKARTDAIVYDSTHVKALFVYGLELVSRLHLFEGVVGRAYERT